MSGIAAATASDSTGSPSPPTSQRLLVFADDWGRHPSSTQHLVRRLLPRYRVGWVNTIGTRPPRLDAATLRRIHEKARHWLGPARASAPLPAFSNAPGPDVPEPEVLSPLMWPWFRHAWDRALNRRLLERGLGRWIAADTGAVAALTVLPIAADLIGRLPVARWVYYCVDDFSEWPGLDAAPLRRMEADLVRRADVVIAASERLRERLQTLRPDVSVLTHGVDLALWRGGAGQGDGHGSDGGATAEEPEAVRGLERPLVLFWGLIDRRLDVGFLARLAEDLERGTIVLLGPESAPDPALARVPRLRRLGAVPPEQLPAYARAAEVLVMPYADSPVTQMMQPLKMLEYLATDRPAVMRDLPAAGLWSACLDTAGTAAAFSAAVRLRLETGLPAAQAAARRRLDSEDWSAKATTFERLIWA